MRWGGTRDFGLMSIGRGQEDGLCREEVHKSLWTGCSCSVLA